MSTSHPKHIGDQRLPAISDLFQIECQGFSNIAGIDLSSVMLTRATGQSRVQRSATTFCSRIGMRCANLRHTTAQGMGLRRLLNADRPGRLPLLKHPANVRPSRVKQDIRQLSFVSATLHSCSQSLTI